MTFSYTYTIFDRLQYNFYPNNYAHFSIYILFLPLYSSFCPLLSCCRLFLILHSSFLLQAVPNLILIFPATSYPYTHLSCCRLFLTLYSSFLLQAVPNLILIFPATSYPYTHLSSYILSLPSYHGKQKSCLSKTQREHGQALVYSASF